MDNDMANGVRKSDIRKEVARHGTLYTPNDVSRAGGSHPLTGSTGWDSKTQSHSKPSWGLNLHLNGDNEYLAIPFLTWVKIIRHFSLHKKKNRHSADYARAFRGLVSWTFGISGVATVKDWGVGTTEENGRTYYNRDHENARTYNMLLVHDLGWETRRVKLQAEYDKDNNAFFDKYGPREEPIEPYMEKEVFLYMFDPMENAFYYPPNMKAKFDFEQGYLSMYGYNPEKVFPVDENHRMRFGDITFL